MMLYQVLYGFICTNWNLIYFYFHCRKQNKNNLHYKIVEVDGKKGKEREIKSAEIYLKKMTDALFDPDQMSDKLRSRRVNFWMDNRKRPLFVLGQDDTTGVEMCAR